MQQITILLFHLQHHQYDSSSKILNKKTFFLGQLGLTHPSKLLSVENLGRNHVALAVFLFPMLAHKCPLILEHFQWVTRRSTFSHSRTGILRFQHQHFLQPGSIISTSLTSTSISISTSSTSTFLTTWFPGSIISTSSNSSFRIWNSNIENDTMARLVAVEQEVIYEF